MSKEVYTPSDEEILASWERKDRERKEREAAKAAQELAWEEERALISAAAEERRLREEAKKAEEIAKAPEREAARKIEKEAKSKAEDNKRFARLKAKAEAEKKALLEAKEKAFALQKQIATQKFKVYGAMIAAVMILAFGGVVVAKTLKPKKVEPVPALSIISSPSGQTLPRNIAVGGGVVMLKGFLEDGSCDIDLSNIEPNPSGITTILLPNGEFMTFMTEEAAEKAGPIPGLTKIGDLPANGEIKIPFIPVRPNLGRERE